MNRCVLKASHGIGTRVFYYRYNEPYPELYDFDSVWIYSDKELTKILMGCHVNQIVKIDDSHKSDNVGYLCERAFEDIRGEWHDEI